MAAGVTSRFWKVGEFVELPGGIRRRAKARCSKLLQSGETGPRLARRVVYSAMPQHFLNVLPEPQMLQNLLVTVIDRVIDDSHNAWRTGGSNEASTRRCIADLPSDNRGP